MKKIFKSSLFILIFALLACCVAFALPVAKSNVYAAGTEIVIASNLTEVKTNAAGQEFKVTATVKNSSGTNMLGAQVKLNFDVQYFEFVSFNKSTDIENSEYSRPDSNTSAGYIVLMGDDNGKPMSKTQWVIGSITLKIKSGVTLPSGSSGNITANEIELLDEMGEDAQPTVTGANIAINFAAPSTACEITELKVNNQTPTKTGNSYACTVPYAYSNLNSGLSVKVSAGATFTVSKKDLNVGSNAVTITVTAEDGVNSQAYTLNVTRTAGDTRKALTSLKMLIKGGNTLVDKSAADLASAATFDAGEIPFADKDKLRVEFAKESNLSTVQVILDSGASKGGASLDLGTVNAGAHTLIVKVTPEDGSAANEYKITFNVIAAEQGATLSALSLKIVKTGGDEAVNFAESFSPTTTTYSATVPQGTTKVKVEATAAGEFATVEGVRVYSKEYTVPCSITIKVKAQSGAETPYTIIVSIAKDTSGLTLTNVSAVGLLKNGNTVVSEHPLVIENTSVDDYFTVSIPFSLDITHFKIKADQFVSDEYRVEGINYDIDINRAEKTKHLVRFIKNNVVEKTITYDIIYESNVKTLSRLTYGGADVDLSTGLNYFFVEVTKETETIIIAPTTTDPNAKATVISIISDNGTPAAGTRDVRLAGGINPILITVKATNGDEGTYVLCIMRPLGAQLLTKLECEDNDLFEGSAVNDNSNIYYHTASSDSVLIKANAIEGATITLYDSHMNELRLSDEVKLAGGNNPYFIKVEAQDGTVSGYTVNIYREASSTNNSMPFIVAIIVISVVAVLVIIALTVVIIVNRRKA